MRELGEQPVTQLVSAEQGLPNSVRSMVRGRLLRLAEPERELMSALACARPPVALEDLVGVVGSDAGVLVDALVGRRLLSAAVAGKTSFVHAFWREEVREAIGADGRRQWHTRWAEHLDGIEERLVERAEHLLASEAGAEARESLLAAADQLFAAFQHSSSIEFYLGALARTDEDSEERMALYLRIVRACWEAHAPPQQLLEICEAWAADARARSDRENEADATRYAAVAHRQAKTWSEARRTAERAVRLAHECENSELIADTSKTTASILWETWDHEAALAMVESAIEHAREANTWVYAACLYNAGIMLTSVGRAGEALRALHRSKRLFLEHKTATAALVARTNETIILAQVGDMDRAITVAREMVDELRQTALPVPVELGLENLVFLLVRSGRYSEALGSARDLMDEATRCGRHGRRVAGLLAMAEAYSELGEVETAREQNRLALELARALGDERQLLYARLALVRELREQGRLRAAATESEAVYEGAEEERAFKQKILAALELAEIALAEEHLDEAHDWLDAAESVLRPSSLDGRVLHAQLLLVRARVWEREGELAPASAAVEQGLGLARCHGSHKSHVGLLDLLARLHDAAGRGQARDRALLEAARAIREVSERLESDAHRAGYLGTPERAALLAASRRAEERDAGRHAEAALQHALEAQELLLSGRGAEAALIHVLRAALAECGAERAVLLAREGGGRTPTLVASAGEPAEKLEAFASLLALVIEDLPGVREPALELELGLEQEGESGVEPLRALRAQGVRRLAIAPARSHGQVSGWLAVEGAASERGLGRDELRLLGALARQSGLLLEVTRRGAALDEEVRAPSPADEEVCRFGGLVTSSTSFAALLGRLERVAEADVPVVVLGESGTGKELVARGIHERSARRDGSFLRENCAAFPEQLLESILFGHVKGAFTGADEDSAGLFELARGGTLFLDEIGEMSPGLQSSLLRVLQEGEFRPVGSHEILRTDARIIAATHRDLSTLIRDGKFRQDLYFRLSGFTVNLPPLRDRREDVPLLARYFLRRSAVAQGRSAPELSAAVRRELLAHDWPGNVRELENLIRRLLLFQDGDRIELDALENDVEFQRARTSAAASRAPRPVPVKEPKASRPRRDGEEARKIRDALARTGGRRDRAAALLGISRATFYRRLKKHGLDTEL